MRIRFLTGREVRGSLLPFLVHIYTAAFSEPPYQGVDPAAFADTLLRHSEHRGFLAVAAEEEQTIAGFCYGYTSRPGGWWHDRVRPALDVEAARLWLQDAFELVELAVYPPAQGRGVGGRLHDRLLEAAGRAHARAVLSTLEAETPAMQLYRRRGWQVLLQGFRFGSGVPYRILGRRLQPASPTEAGLIRIRPATPADAEPIRAVASGSWAEVYRGLIPKEVQHRLLASWYAPGALRAGIEQDRNPLMVADDAGAPCGFAQMGMIDPHTAGLHRLYVLPAYQRLGLGTRLYQAVLQRLRERSPRIQAVEVGVEEGNVKGRSFYEKLGFRLVGRTEESLPGGDRLPTVRYRLETA